MRDCLSTAWWKFSNFGTPPPPTTSAWAEKRRAGWPAKPYLAGELGAWVTADAAAALGSCCSPPHHHHHHLSPLRAFWLWVNYMLEPLNSGAARPSVGSVNKECGGGA